MRRVAWFHIVIDTEDEHVANVWLATVNQALEVFAQQAAEICRGQVKVVGLSEAGQSIPVEDQSEMRPPPPPTKDPYEGEPA